MRNEEKKRMRKDGNSAIRERLPSFSIDQRRNEKK